MKIVLIRPARNYDKGFFSVQTPINLAGMASFLKEKGHECRIWDFEVDEPECLEKKMRMFSPELVGISCMTHIVSEGNRMGRRIKKIDPSVYIVAGGPHPTALTERTLQEFSSFDAVVVGEGEYPLADIAEAREKDKIPGLVFRAGKEIKSGPPPRLIEDIDSLPFPDRSLLSGYRDRHRHATRGIRISSQKVTQIFTSRGCPFKCIFCAIHPIHSRTVRYRSVDKIMQEVEECQDRFNIEHFIFQDDTFTLNKVRTLEICRGLRERKVRSWSCDGRVDTVDRELLSIMKEAGCKKISFGVESGSPRIQKLNGKGITSDQIHRAFRCARQAGIELLEGTFMIGSHPSETKEEVEMTLELAKGVKPDIFFLAVAVPYPGTELWNIMEREGYINEYDWSSFTMYGDHPSWRMEHFEPDDLVWLQRRYLKRFYLRPAYIFRRLKSLKNLNELIYWMRQGVNYLWSR